MTPEQVLVAIAKYESRLDTLGDLPVPRARIDSNETEPGNLVLRMHVLWMCDQVRSFVRTDIEKAMRWLGFIQGVLWARLGVSIEEMKGDNR